MRIENQFCPGAAVAVAQMEAMLPSMQLEAGKPEYLRSCNSGAQAMADGEECVSASCEEARANAETSACVISAARARLTLQVQTSW